MKRLFLFTFLASIFMLNVASMCSNDDNPTPNSTVDPTPVIQTVSTGTWKITLYQDS